MSLYVEFNTDNYFGETLKHSKVFFKLKNIIYVWGYFVHICLGTFAYLEPSEGRKEGVTSLKQTVVILHVGARK